jgi:hypothetical protein
VAAGAILRGELGVEPVDTTVGHVDRRGPRVTGERRVLVLVEAEVLA